MRKKKRISLFTPEERALFATHEAELEARLAACEAELVAAKSPLVAMDLSERLDYSIQRLRKELAAAG